MMVPATSSIQPNKADCSKCVICQYKVEKLVLCVKRRDCGPKRRDCGLKTIFENRIHFVYSFRKCIALLNMFLKGYPLEAKTAPKN